MPRPPANPVQPKRPVFNRPQMMPLFPPTSPLAQPRPLELYEIDLPSVSDLPDLPLTFNPVHKIPIRNAIDLSTNTYPFYHPQSTSSRNDTSATSLHGPKDMDAKKDCKKVSNMPPQTVDGLINCDEYMYVIYPTSQNNLASINISSMFDPQHNLAPDRGTNWINRNHHPRKSPSNQPPLPTSSTPSHQSAQDDLLEAFHIALRQHLEQRHLHQSLSPQSSLANRPSSPLTPLTHTSKANISNRFHFFFQPSHSDFLSPQELSSFYPNLPNYSTSPVPSPNLSTNSPNSPNSSSNPQNSTNNHPTPSTPSFPLLKPPLHHSLSVFDILTYARHCARKFDAKTRLIRLFLNSSSCSTLKHVQIAEEIHTLQKSKKGGKLKSQTSAVLDRQLAHLRAVYMHEYSIWYAKQQGIWRTNDIEKSYEAMDDLLFDLQSKQLQRITLSPEIFSLFNAHNDTTRTELSEPNTASNSPQTSSTNCTPHQAPHHLSLQHTRPHEISLAEEDLFRTIIRAQFVTANQARTSALLSPSNASLSVSPFPNHHQIDGSTCCPSSSPEHTQKHGQASTQTPTTHQFTSKSNQPRNSYPSISTTTSHTPAHVDKSAKHVALPSTQSTTPITDLQLALERLFQLSGSQLPDPIQLNLQNNHKSNFEGHKIANSTNSPQNLNSMVDMNLGDITGSSNLLPNEISHRNPFTAQSERMNSGTHLYTKYLTQQHYLNYLQTTFRTQPSTQPESSQTGESSNSDDFADQTDLLLLPPPPQPSLNLPPIQLSNSQLPFINQNLLHPDRIINALYDSTNTPILGETQLAEVQAALFGKKDIIVPEYWSHSLFIQAQLFPVLKNSGKKVLWYTLREDEDAAGGAVGGKTPSGPQPPAQGASGNNSSNNNSNKASNASHGGAGGDDDARSGGAKAGGSAAAQHPGSKAPSGNPAETTNITIAHAPVYTLQHISTANHAQPTIKQQIALSTNPAMPSQVNIPQTGFAPQDYVNSVWYKYGAKELYGAYTGNAAATAALLSSLENSLHTSHCVHGGNSTLWLNERNQERILGFRSPKTPYPIQIPIFTHFYFYVIWIEETSNWIFDQHWHHNQDALRRYKQAFPAYTALQNVLNQLVHFCTQSQLNYKPPLPLKNIKSQQIAQRDSRPSSSVVAQNQQQQQQQQQLPLLSTSLSPSIATSSSIYNLNTIDIANTPQQQQQQQNSPISPQSPLTPSPNQINQVHFQHSHPYISQPYLSRSASQKQQQIPVALSHLPNITAPLSNPLLNQHLHPTPAHMIPKPLPLSQSQPMLQISRLGRHKSSTPKTKDSSHSSHTPKRKSRPTTFYVDDDDDDEEFLPSGFLSPSSLSHRASLHHHTTMQPQGNYILSNSTNNQYHNWFNYQIPASVKPTNHILSYQQQQALSLRSYRFIVQHQFILTYFGHLFHPGLLRTNTPLQKLARAQRQLLSRTSSSTTTNIDNSTTTSINLTTSCTTATATTSGTPTTPATPSGISPIPTNASTSQPPQKDQKCQKTQKTSPKSKSTQTTAFSTPNALNSSLPPGVGIIDVLNFSSAAYRAPNTAISPFLNTGGGISTSSTASAGAGANLKPNQPESFQYHRCQDGLIALAPGIVVKGVYQDDNGLLHLKSSKEPITDVNVFLHRLPTREQFSNIIRQHNEYLEQYPRQQQKTVLNLKKQAMQEESEQQVQNAATATSESSASVDDENVPPNMLSDDHTGDQQDKIRGRSEHEQTTAQAALPSLPSVSIPPTMGDDDVIIVDSIEASTPVTSQQAFLPRPHSESSQGDDPSSAQPSDSVQTSPVQPAEQLPGGAPVLSTSSPFAQSPKKALTTSSTPQTVTPPSLLSTLSKYFNILDVITNLGSIPSLSVLELVMSIYSIPKPLILLPHLLPRDASGAPECGVLLALPQVRELMIFTILSWFHTIFLPQLDDPNSELAKFQHDEKYAQKAAELLNSDDFVRSLEFSQNLYATMHTTIVSFQQRIDNELIQQHREMIKQQQLQQQATQAPLPAKSALLSAFPHASFQINPVDQSKLTPVTLAPKKSSSRPKLPKFDPSTLPPPVTRTSNTTPRPPAFSSFETHDVIQPPHHSSASSLLSRPLATSSNRGRSGRNRYTPSYKEDTSASDLDLSGEDSDFSPYAPHTSSSTPRRGTRRGGITKPPTQSGSSPSSGVLNDIITAYPSHPSNKQQPQRMQHLTATISPQHSKFPAKTQPQAQQLQIIAPLQTSSIAQIQSSQIMQPPQPTASPAILLPSSPLLSPSVINSSLNSANLQTDLQFDTVNSSAIKRPLVSLRIDTHSPKQSQSSQQSQTIHFDLDEEIKVKKFKHAQSINDDNDNDQFVHLSSSGTSPQNQ